MKKTNYYIALLALPVMLLSACGTGKITQTDMIKQRAEAYDAISEAKEESVKLAEMKEQFSEDQQKADLKTLKERQKEIENDLKRLDKMETADAQGDSEDLTARLKSRKSEVEKLIKQVKDKPKENWEESVKTIDRQIKVLLDEVDKITGNIKEE